MNKANLIEGSKNDSAYMPQLDALRAFAVICVIFYHYLPTTNPIQFFLPWGIVGVKLFLVLSSFLATNSLLRSRHLIHVQKQNPWLLIRKFYFRRFLRIIPIYYLTIFVAALLNIPTVKEHIFWHLTFLSNIYIVLYGWLGYESHFWYLAVDMQFYLIWPFLMIFLPDKYLRPTIFIAILIGPLSRLISLLIGFKLAATVLPTSCLDALGLGALLAYYNYLNSDNTKAKLLKYGLYIGLLLLIISKCIRVAINYPDAASFGYEVIIQDLAIALISVYLIGNATKGFKGIFGKILELKPILYLGQISYGMYLFHNFMPIINMYPRLFNILHLPYPNSLELKLVYQVMATVIVATFSLHLIEKPISSFKGIVK